MEKPVWVKAGCRLISIDLKSLVFIYGNKHGCKVILLPVGKHIAEEVPVSNSLSSLEKKLTDNNIIRCHRNYLVNRNFHKHFNVVESKIYFKAYEIPISRRSFKKVLNEFNLNTVKNGTGKDSLCRTG